MVLAGDAVLAIVLFFTYGVWKIYTANDEVHVVMSRDSGPVSAHTDFDEAKDAADRQSVHEEMGGGRPSVWVVTMPLDRKLHVKIG